MYKSQWQLNELNNERLLFDWLMTRTLTVHCILIQITTIFQVDTINKFWVNFRYIAFKYMFWRKTSSLFLDPCSPDMVRQDIPKYPPPPFPQFYELDKCQSVYVSMYINIRWDCDDVCFVLDKHVQVASLTHIILIPKSASLCSFYLMLCDLQTEKQQIS